MCVAVQSITIYNLKQAYTSSLEDSSLIPFVQKAARYTYYKNHLYPPQKNLLHHLADGCFKKSSCRTCVVTFCQGWHLWHIAKCFYFSSHTSMHGLITHENSFQWVTKQLHLGSKINLACTRGHMLLFSVGPDLAHIQHNCQMLLLPIQAQHQRMTSRICPDVEVCK